MKQDRLVLFLAIGAALAASTLQAATFVVDATVDAPDSNRGDGVCATSSGDCTLRAAFEETASLEGDDSIEIPAGTYVPTDGALETLDYPSGGLGKVTVRGASRALTILDGAGSVLIDHQGPAMELFDLTLRDAEVRVTIGADVVLERIHFETVDVEGPDSFGFGFSLQMEHVTSAGPLGLKAARGSVADCVLEGLVLTGDFRLSVVDCSIDGEVTAQLNGINGFLDLDRVIINGGVDFRGGELQNSLSLDHCRISGSATDGVRASLDGGLFITNSAIVGSAGCGVLASLLDAGRSVVVQDSEISGNGCGVSVSHSASTGVGRLHIIRSKIRDNAGVGVRAPASFDGSSPFILEDSEISGNSGAGVAMGSQQLSGAAPLGTILRSTISGNFDSGIVMAGPGAIELDIVNSTLSGNSAPGQGAGLQAWGTVSIKSSTIVANTGPPGIGGLQIPDGTSVTVQNTILAGNSATDCSGNLESGGYNLIGDPTGCSITGVTEGNLLGSDAELEPLAHHGGFTPTHRPLATSPVIDSGNPAGCPDIDRSVLTSDQRNQPRPAGLACDIGSVELGLVLTFRTSTDVEWPLAFDVVGYDLIRGTLDSLSASDNTLDLGSVACLADDDATGVISDSTPPPFDTPFFYLLRLGQEGAGYGASSAGALRVPIAGDCLD